MLGNKRYLAARTEQLEKQSRWLTILVSAIIVVLVVAITAGPALVRTLGETTDSEEPDTSAQDTNLQN